MRILITANCMWNLSHFRLGLIKDLIKSGHEIHALAPYDGHEIMLEKMGVQVSNLQMNAHSTNLIHDYFLYKKLRSKFNEIKPHSILSYTIKNNIYGAIAARTLRLKFIPNVTGLGTMFLSGYLKKAIAHVLYKFAFKHVACVFFQNTDDARLFEAKSLVNSKQIRLLPGSGIDVKKFSGTCSQSKDIKFLMISRLIREKGLLEYIQAAQKVCATQPQIKFQLIGSIDESNASGVSEATLMAWVEQGVIEYLGVQEDIRSFIQAASCIVLPSYREGAPRVLIEAAAMARPSIATNVPGCNSVVDHSITGLLVAVKDVESLTRAMLEFIDMSVEQREAMGRSARQKAETTFDEQLVIQAYKAEIGNQ